MITFTIDLALAGALSVVYYAVGVVVLTVGLFVMRGNVSPKPSVKQTLRKFPRVFLLAPLFPYIAVEEARYSWKKAKRKRERALAAV